jgi:RNA polymerase sigma-70 factor (ECF subfamily)
MTDFDALTERATNGDRDALHELLVRYLPELRAFVRLRAGAVALRKDGETDLVQSVCREVLTHAERFQHPNEGAFKRWLFATALRKILNRREHHLAAKRDVLREQGLGGEEELQRGLLDVYSRFSSPSGRAELHEELERVETAMQSLSEEQREVITLAHVVGLSRAEIAESIGKSEGAVRNILYRALAELGTALS